MAASVGYGLFIDRDSGTFDFQIDYQIDGYSDPETGEYFGNTSWSFLAGPPGGPLNGTGDFGAESNSVLMNFGLDSDPALKNYVAQFSAMNTFSGDSVAANWNILTAAYATADLAINGSGGLDIIIAGAGDDSLAGLGGNDHIDAGAGNDTIGGGEGSDTLDGSLGDDVMVGGADDDLYRVDSALDIVVEHAGEGNDVVQSTVDYRLSANVEALMLIGIAVSGDGSAGANRIEGNGVGNHLSGLGGNDTLRGNDGDDSLSGGSGHDRLEGGQGVDRLEGGLGNDTYVIGDSDIVVEESGAGTDTVIVNGLTAYALGANIERLVHAGAASFRGVGNALANDLRGGTGADLLSAGDGSDRVDGGDGNDRLVGGAGADLLIGRAGVDTADYASSQAGVTASLITGTATGGDAEGDRLLGIENVLGSAFSDVIDGNGGANDLAGGAGDDTIRGGAGADRVSGGAGADALDGGTGRDVLSYARSAAGAVTVDLALGLVSGGDAEGDTIAGFESAEGGNGDDSLLGSTSANGLAGGGGADFIDGGDGDDVVSGGAGGDTLAGGAGRDWVSYAGSASRVVVNLATQTTSTGDADGDVISGFENARGGSGNDRLIGSSGANSLAGGAGADSISGGGADDVVNGGAGADILAGGAGIDRLSFAGASAGRFVSLATGTTTEGDTISGFEQVEGSGFGDALYGDGGSNSLFGRAGFDFLDGAAGNDVLSGGADGDIFSFADGYGRDVVTDFTRGSDQLQLLFADGAFDTFEEVMAAANGARGGSDTVITFAADAVLVLRNVALETLTADDFLFG